MVVPERSSTAMSMAALASSSLGKTPELYMSSTNSSVSPCLSLSRSTPLPW